MMSHNYWDTRKLSLNSWNLCTWLCTLYHTTIWHLEKTSWETLFLHPYQIKWNLIHICIQTSKQHNATNFKITNISLIIYIENEKGSNGRSFILTHKSPIITSNHSNITTSSNILNIHNPCFYHLYRVIKQLLQPTKKINYISIGKNINLSHMKLLHQSMCLYIYLKLAFNHQLIILNS